MVETLERIHPMVTAFCLSVIIVVCALIFARPALKKASKKGLAVFCAFAIAAAVSAQKANTNAPPDDVSGPVPELTGDTEPGSEGDDSDEDLSGDAPGPRRRVVALYVTQLKNGWDWV